MARRIRYIRRSWVRLVFAGGDARSTTVMCGFEFCDAESGESLFSATSEVSQARRRPIEQSLRFPASGQALLRSVMSRKVWLTVRRSSEVDLVEMVEFMECGAEVLELFGKEGRHV